MNHPLKASSSKDVYVVGLDTTMFIAILATITGRGACKPVAFGSTNSRTIASGTVSPPNEERMLAYKGSL